MKIIRYLLLIIALLAILFLAVGFIKPVVDYGSTITVNKPVEEAWAVSQNESLYAEWLEGFKSMELIEGEKFEVGSKYRIVVNPGDGQEDFEMIETITSIEEHDHIEMEFDSDAMDFYQKMTFSEEGGNTTITTKSKVKGKGLFTRSLFACMEIMGGVFAAQEQKNMDALKTLIDENTTDYSPPPSPDVPADTTAGNSE